MDGLLREDVTWKDVEDLEDKVLLEGDGGWYAEHNWLNT